MTRSHWQVLNTVFEKEEVTKEALFKLLCNFVNESNLSEILEYFVLKNWIKQAKSPESGITSIQMTEAGKEAFAEILITQNKTRKQLFQGISNEEYKVTVKVLKQLIENASL